MKGQLRNLLVEESYTLQTFAIKLNLVAPSWNCDQRLFPANLYDAAIRRNCLRNCYFYFSLESEYSAKQSQLRYTNNRSSNMNTSALSV